jgi:nitronate monooxygenase
MNKEMIRRERNQLLWGAKMLENELTKLLQIKYPIIQAPMAGGITTAELITAVSNSGGLGNIGAGYLSPIQLREEIKEVKKLTIKPFGVNLFVPKEFQVSNKQVEFANEKLRAIRMKLNIDTKVDNEFPTFEQLNRTFYEQVRVVIEEKVPVCSFVFGIPSKDVITELKQHHIILIGTATTLEEAVEIEKKGLDMAVVQGSEAGGHRGSFIREAQESLVGLMSLIPQVVDHLKIPVIAAGGIMDGRGLMASLVLGAKGVQMGTAFITCKESGAHPLHKRAILDSTQNQTVLTRSLTGRMARAINNKFVIEMKDHEKIIPEFPIQRMLTQSIMKASANQNNPEYMLILSGQNTSLAKNQTVNELINNIMKDASRMN